MTEEIIPWDKNLRTNSTESVSLLKSQTTENISSTLAGYTGSRPSQNSEINITSVDDEIKETSQTEPIPIKRIYPHVFDEEIKAGQVLILLRNSINDAKEAIDAFGEPDLQAVTTRLTQIAVTMSKAHSLTEFNENFGAVVSYIRRATLSAPNAELSRSALNSLVHVLEMMVENPMIDLDEACELVEKLSNEGWRGEHKLVDELIAALVDSYELDLDEAQALLFPDNQIETTTE